MMKRAVNKPVIAILGGGNMGSLLATKFSKFYKVILFLNSPYEKKEDYIKNIKSFNDKGEVTVGKIAKITENLSEAIEASDWIFVTFPSFLFDSFSKIIVPLLRPGQHLVGIPGSGGFELFFKDALNKGCTITGLQRVHSVARVIKSGKEVRESGVRSLIRCASIPKKFNKEASCFLSKCYALPVEEMDNYLNVTLINSNPILHTSRLYSIFSNFSPNNGYDSLPLFYEDWSVETSDLLIKMDNELFDVFLGLRKRGLVVDKITRLLDHYESKNANEMTNKISNIESLKNLSTPSLRGPDGKLYPDFKNRYFSADFPFGLDILLSFSCLLGVDCPNMRKVSNWYHLVTNSKVDFRLSNFSLNLVKDLVDFYNQ